METKLQRRSFNQGLLSPELYYRSDLEAYFSGCKSLHNMEVTPWGGVRRRPPTRLLSTIDTAKYGYPKAYIPFRYSNTDYYHLVVTDNSGSRVPWNPKFPPSTATGTDAPYAKYQYSHAGMGILVFAPDGSLETLWGDNAEGHDDPPSNADRKFLATFWSSDSGDFNPVTDISTTNINDVIFVTTKSGEFPVCQIYRFEYKHTGEKYWAFEPNVARGGPFINENADESNGLTIYSRDQVMQEVNGTKDISFPGGRDLSKYVNRTETPSLQNIDTLRTDACFPYLLSFDQFAPFGGDLENGLFKVRIASNDMSLDWKTSDGAPKIENLGQSFYHGSFNTKDQISNNGGSVAMYDLSTMYVAGADSGDNKKKISRKQFDMCTSYCAPAQGVVRLKTTGVWDGTLVLEETKDGVHFTEIGRINSENGNNNEIIEREVTGWEYSVRVRMQRAKKVTPDIEDQKIVNEGCFWTLEPELTNLYFRVIRKVDEKNVVAVSINEVWGWPPDENAVGPHGHHYWYPMVEDSIWTARSGNFSYLHKGRVSSADADSFANFRYADDLSTLKTFTTTDWSVGGFSKGAGHPFAHCIHNERLVLGGSKAFPDRIWASRVNDWTDFEETGSEVSAFNFTVQSNTVDGIRWLISNQSLMMGTADAEILVTHSDGQGGFSATNISVEPQTRYGSSKVNPVIAADTVFFVQGGSRTIRSINYNLQKDKMMASDMAILAHHIFDGELFHNIVKMDFYRNPQSNLVVLRESGDGAVLVYDDEQQIAGWSTFHLGGTSPDGEKSEEHIVDMGVNSGRHGDNLVCIAKRPSNGHGPPVYSLEQIDNRDYDFTHSSRNRPPYLDSYIVTTPDKTPDHYFSPAVIGVVDGSWRTLTNGDGLTYDASGKVYLDSIPGNPNVYLGYPTEFEIEPTDLVKPYDFGPLRSTPALNLYFHHSNVPHLEVNGRSTSHGKGAVKTTSEEFNFEDVTGPVKVSTNPGLAESISVRLHGSDAYPFELLAIGVDNPDVGGGR